MRCRLACAAMLLAASSAAAAPPAQEVGERSFGTAIERYRKAGGSPGCSGAWALGDSEVVTGFAGVADRESGRPVDADTRFLSGSMGKSFVAAVGLALSREEKLDLDAPIRTWLGDEPWFDRLPNAHRITLRMLLTHTSGVPDHLKMLRLGLRAVLQLFLQDPPYGFTIREELEYVLDEEPLFPPGEGFAYTDTGYLVAGLVIEKATGRTYYEELRRLFLDPLALDQTDPSDRITLAGLAVGDPASLGYIPLVDWVFPRRMVEDGKLQIDPRTEWTGGGLVTTPRDLVRWARALYTERAIPGAYLDEILRPGYVAENPGPGDTTTYGLGVTLHADGALGPRWGHSGYFPGYTGVMTYFPKSQLTLAVQCNGDGPFEDRDAVVEEIAREILGGS